MRLRRRLGKVDQVTDKHKQNDKLGNLVKIIGSNFQTIDNAPYRDIRNFPLRFISKTNC